MGFSSTYPAVKAALIAAWDAAMTAAVINGPVIGIWQEPVVTVGYQDDTTQTAADGVLSRQGMSPEPEREQYTINCAAAVNYQTSDVLAAETVVFGLFAAAGQVLEVNPTLGGAMSVRIDRYQLVESQAPPGVIVILKFGVAVDAYTAT